MPTTIRPLLVTYGIAAASVAGAVGVRLLLAPVLHDSSPLTTLYLAILVTAWYGGFGPAVAATVLGAVTAALFLLAPGSDHPTFEPERQAGLLFYGVIGFGIAALGGAMHAARRRAEASAAVAVRQREDLLAALQMGGDSAFLAIPQVPGAAARPSGESILEWKRARQAVREQADVLRGILAASVDHIYVVDRQGRYRHVSAGGARILGFEPHDVVGKTWRDLGLPAELMERFDAQREGVLRSGVPAFAEAVFPNPAGDTRHFEYVVAPIAGAGGQPEAVVVVSRDVSARRKTEQELRHTEAMLIAVINHAPACVFAKDRQGRYLLANQSLAHLVGRAPPDFIGRTDFDFFPAAVAEQFGKDDAAVIAAGQPRTYEESFVQQGVPRTYLTVKFPLRDDQGNVYGTCAVATEVTDLKRTQEALRATADRLNLALVAARLGDWRWDAGSDVVTFSDRAAEIFGIPPGPHMTWTAMQGLLHGEDRDRARRAVERAVAGRTHYDIEYRVQRPDGTQVWVAALGHAHYGPNGEPLGMFGVVQDVTARKGAEEALRESEERFRGLMEQAPFSVQLFAPDGLTLRVNAAWQELWGVTADRITDYNVLQDAQLEAKGILPFLRRAFAGEAVEIPAIQYDPNETIPNRTRHEDPRRWVAAVAYPLKDHHGQVREVVLVHDDRTARVRAEESLRRSEQDARFLAAASAALAGLVDYGSTLQMVAQLSVPHFADWAAVDMLDENGDVRRLAVAHIDPARVELGHELHRRFPPDPAAPRGVWHILRTGESEIVSDLSDEMLATSVGDADLLAILRQLGLKSYLGVPLSVRGKVLGVVTFIAAESGRRYDAAALAVAEDLAHRAAIAVENARLYQEVREADRRKDEFLAVLGHELRNPLAPISNALQILKLPTADTAVVAQAREMMERQVVHMVRLVDDLLDVSRIVRGKIELRTAPVELAAVVARAVETAQPLIDAEGHELTVALPSRPLIVRGDPVRLAQVVANLLNNAARYTDRGGKIRIEAERLSDRVVLRVRDTGIGIAADVLPRIWDMFVQADRRLKSAQGGMGIGLALVKGLVELHGGTVEARSAGPGQGSEFAVTLPLLMTAELSRPRASSRPASAAPRRVLVVDDNADAAVSLALLLRLEGHAVEVANDGPTALRLAAAAPPDVAFLDIGMPVMDGYELARRFRADPALRGVLLVALTGWGQDEDRRRTKEAGFDAHEVKPVNPDVLDRLLVASSLSGG